MRFPIPDPCLTPYRNLVKDARVWWLVYCIVLAAISATLFTDLGRHDWAFDDEDFIANARTAQDRFLYVFSPYKPFPSRPTVHLYFWAAYPFLGESPTGYHLANVVLHTANAALLASLVYSLAGRFLLASAAGALFLTSLTHFRAYYWIAGASHLLCVGLGLVSALAMVRHLRTGRRVCYWLCLLLLLLSAFAHEAGIVFVVMLWLILRWHGPPYRYHLIAPAAVVPLLVWLVSRFVYPTFLTPGSAFGLGSHVLYNIPVMIYRLFAGHSYEVWLLPWYREQQALVGAGIALLLAAAAYRHRALRPAAVWTVTATLPFAFWVEGPVFWRYYYLACTGSCLVIAAAIYWLGQYTARVSGRSWLLSILIVAATAFLVTVNVEPLHRLQAVQCSYAGQYLMGRKEHARAKVQFDRALALYPGNPWEPVWHYNRALCFMALGNSAGALNELLLLVRMSPDYDKAYRVLLNVYAVCSGAAALSLNQPTLDRFVAQLPADIEIYIDQGDVAKAEGLVRLYLHYVPGDSRMTQILAALQQR